MEFARRTSAGPATSRLPAGAARIDLAGKTVMPATISTHVHPVFQKGLTCSADFTQETILDDLNRELYFGDGASLVPGKRADFLVLDANPLDDIRNTRRIARMYLAGAKVGRAAIKTR
jgi:imidazolonepropionase-like amidohydrolase